LDEYNESFYSVSAARNPLSGAQSLGWLLNNYTSVQSNRVLRGGSWNYDTDYVVAAKRLNSNPSNSFSHFGFRCVRAVSP